MNNIDRVFVGIAYGFGGAFGAAVAGGICISLYLMIA